MSESSQEQIEESEVLTQSGYQETPYSDASWEVIGEPPGDEVFLPMEIEKLDADAQMVDPMFADFGGMTDSESVLRWHLPEGQGIKLQQEEEEEEDNRISLTPEEIEEIKKQAFAEGHQSAMENEVIKNAERMTTIEQNLTALIDDLNKQILEHQKFIQVNSIEFSLAVARKILDTTVEINPEYITQIIEEALSQSGTSAVRKIRVSPEDLEFISLIGLEKRIKEFDGSWIFEADQSIKSGCVLESTAGVIDYQLDKAWERIKDTVMKVIR
ncbi:MAG: hypothetical protein KDD56_09365 [Bdellovibrionales bacterium]|nr:hypothetical protein [Bdellovibrionales bacterium]